MLDHILLGCSDLDAGIAFVEEHTGVRAAFGGVHPGRGTQNALISLGEPSRRELNPRRYLEIIAPDPAQSGAPDRLGLQKLDEPHLVGWAAHPGDLNEFATRLRSAAIAFDGPTPGSRKRPDGRVLKWQALTLKDNTSWTLPFFIEWSADSLHPSADSPKGCLLLRFEAATPDPEVFSKQVTLLGLDLPVVRGDKPQLRATINGPKGQFSVTS